MAQIFLFSAEMSVLQYQEDDDFDDAFKHLLQPIESITKKNDCEIFQYDLTKVNFNIKLYILYLHFVMCILY